MKYIMGNSFGEALKQARTERNVSLQQLSRLTSIHPTLLEIYESGKDVPSIQAIIVFASALQMASSELVTMTFHNFKRLNSNADTTPNVITLTFN